MTTRVRHPRFDLKQAKDGQFYFNLTAKNGIVIATSEMYVSKYKCIDAIKSVITNAAIAEINDTTFNDD